MQVLVGRRARWVLVAAATALVLAGCAPGGASPRPSPSNCVQVENALGTACVPAHPKRIVALDPSTALPTLLELGAPVVGTITAFEGSGLPDYLPRRSVSKLTTVGTASEVDAEAVAALKPDLIVGWTSVIQPIRGRLKAIAPTVAMPPSIYDPAWRDDALTIAGLVGGRAKLKADLAALDARLAKLRSRVRAGGSGRELSRVDSYRGRLVAYRWTCTWLGPELRAAGFQMPTTLRGTCVPGSNRSVVVDVSDELIDKVDADVILVYKQNLTGKQRLDPLPDFEKNPLWHGLRAVRKGDAVAVGDAWGQGADAVALGRVVDDLDRLVG